MGGVAVREEERKGGKWSEQRKKKKTRRGQDKKETRNALPGKRTAVTAAEVEPRMVSVRVCGHKGGGRVGRGRQGRERRIGRAGVA